MLRRAGTEKSPQRAPFTRLPLPRRVPSPLNGVSDGSERPHAPSRVPRRRCGAARGVHRWLLAGAGLARLRRSLPCTPHASPSMSAWRVLGASLGRRREEGRRGGAGGAAARRATRAAPGHSARAPWPPSRARRPRPWRPGSACRARAGVCGGRGRGWGRGEEALPPRARRQARHSAAPPPRCCFSICSQSLVAAGYPAGYAFFVLICSSRSFRLPRSPRWLA